MCFCKLHQSFSGEQADVLDQQESLRSLRKFLKITAVNTLAGGKRMNLLIPILCFLFLALRRAEATDAQPIKQIAAAVLDRVRTQRDRSKIEGLTPESVLVMLMPREKLVLATEHVRFDINQQAIVTVCRDKSLGSEPFWLRDGSWRQSSTTFTVGDTQFDVWEKRFDKGTVGLGINSFKGGGRHYFVVVRPLENELLVIDRLCPTGFGITNFVEGARPWADRTDELKQVPARLAGQTLVQTLDALRDDAKLIGRLRWTKYPSGLNPDHVVLTWSDDPRTSQAIQWRTSHRVNRGCIAVTERSFVNRPVDLWTKRPALTRVLLSPGTVNDPNVNRHTVELFGLRPGTTYAYRVGAGEPLRWTEPRYFTTAPAGAARFAFIYLGDAQTGFAKWGKLIQSAYRARPDAAFYVIAGDLVNRGNERDDWDDFFENTKGIFDQRSLVPVIGNHECQGGRPAMYLEQFALPRNGPPGIEPERSYFFEYAGALFVVLDSNLSAQSHAEWLEKVLSSSTARWKFVAFHHPIYSSAPKRDNKTLREVWAPILEKHGVNIVLQGHDHAYLRTHPLRSGHPVNTASGTTYVVAVSGSKMYTQVKRVETAVGFANTPTWQLIEIDVANSRLNYSSYDARGSLRDRFSLAK